jgi:hypothetical protein
VVNAQGLATGWVLGAGNNPGPLLAELLLSTRAGCPQLVGPGTASDGLDWHRRRTGLVSPRVRVDRGKDRSWPISGTMERIGMPIGGKPMVLRCSPASLRAASCPPVVQQGSPGRRNGVCRTM